MTTEQLFQKRMKHSWRQAIHILVSISRGSGFPILIGMIVIFFYMGYQQFLTWYPADFPLALMLAIVYAPIITFTNIRTWLQKADLIFLLPLEHRMQSYFKQSLIYTGSVDLIRMLFLFSVAYPVFRLHMGSSLDYLLTLCWMIALQIMNLLLKWNVLRSKQLFTPFQQKLWDLLRVFIIFFALYTFLQHYWSGALISIIIMLVLLFQSQRNASRIYPWEKMIQIESNTRVRFLNWVNWFVDLPFHAERTIYARKWLMWIIQKTERHQDAFLYLYTRSFIRDRDLFPMYLRINFFFACLIIFIPSVFFQFFAIALSMILEAIQLLDIANPNRYPIWISLYPQQNTLQWSRLIRNLLFVQMFFLSFVAYFSNIPLLSICTLLLIGGISIVLYVYLYLPFKFKKANPTLLG
ncbi:Predicted ABC-type exoprotein transport system, permease component [Seinonella peptonophila]|uniref:Predicted ABC-type exoprotein transport system, permease component n=1 Tax=Seinonella peptonophila TaxID=112248 RepID=A0A1M4TU73_9BACL|nr:ABC transporter permease [Seinonella peptonophila]SHE47944.1 Predicted ABC-type exoprotein transport system, permease component [Seinonella peptonophila]